MTAARRTVLRVALIAALLALFLALAGYARRVGAASWEVETLRAVQSVPGLRVPAEALTLLGAGPPWYGLLTLLLVAVVWLAGRRAGALFLLVVALQLVGTGFKVMVDRARPAVDGIYVWQQLSDGSFPSGHVYSSTLVFGFLILVLERADLPPRLRRALQAACLFWIVSMGVARMAVGAHWPTDVLGGYAL